MEQSTNHAGLDQLQQYAAVRELVDAEEFSEALATLENTSLNSSTKEHLQRALESKEPYIIGRTFGELDARIMQALCWDCWKD